MFKNKIFQDLICQKKLIIKYDNFNRPIFTPENDEGYIEYKLRLDYIDDSKINKLITQMKYRLNEGKIETGKFMAYYFLGIDNDGTIGLINQEALNKTITIIETIASKSNAEIYSIESIQFSEDRNIASVCIRKRYNDSYINEYRIGMLGPSNHGKTTCIGFLTYNEKDNGNGLGRMAVFKHIHEQNTGITSSIKHDILGFKNNIVNNYKSNTTWDKIVEDCDKIISIFDLPGSSKYTKTTIFGISALKLDVHIIVISIPDCYDNENIIFPNNLISLFEMSFYFKIPIFVLFTKLDLVNKQQENNLVNYINNNLFEKFNKKLTYYENINNNDVPYLSISNVTSINYDKFINFLYYASQIKLNHRIISENNKIDFMIYDVINIREVGYIVSGICINGSIKVGDELFIGPVYGKFYSVSIISIKKKQIDSNIIYTNESGSIEIKLKNNHFQIDKHMNILDEQSISKLVDHISIKTNMINYLSIGHQYMLYIDNLIEPVIFHSINKDNNCIFKFVKTHKFYIRNNSKCIIKNNINPNLNIYGFSI